MSTLIQAACWPLQMPPTAKSVLISLADNANDQGVCWPSIPTICQRTCFSERAVHRAIKWLEQHGLLQADRSSGRHTSYVLTPVAYCEPAQRHQVSPPQERRSRQKCRGASEAITSVRDAVAPPQMRQSPPPEMRSNHQEPSLEPSWEPSKRARESRAAFWEPPLPDWLPADVWRDWVSYRKKHKAPFTEKAVELSLRELGKLRAQGFEPKAVIEQSIVNGWKGLFSIHRRSSTDPPVNKQAALEARNAQAGREAKAMLFGG